MRSSSEIKNAGRRLYPKSKKSLNAIFKGFSDLKYGADVGTRTRDLFLTKEVLYLLSYISALTYCSRINYSLFPPLMQALFNKKL